MLDEVIETEREGKPRETGITMVTDLVGALDDALLEQNGDYVDYVKIGMSAPLLMERSRLLERVRRYHDFGIKVLCGGTLSEIAVQKGVTAEILEGLSALEFDAVEVSEHAGRIPMETKRKMADNLSSLSLEGIFQVDWQPGQSSAAIASSIRECFELNSKRVVLSVPTEGEVAKGLKAGIAWDMLNEIVGAFGPPSIIFQDREMSRLTSLILEFGPKVNLAGLSLNEALVLEMQRLGLTTETLGLSRSRQSFEGSPAEKFVFHLVRAEHPIDQATLALRSGLPRRTIQAAVSGLIQAGVVREIADSTDMRKHRYTVS